MEKQSRINSGQFFVMMFVSRIVITITFNSQSAGGESFGDAMVSAALAVPAGFLMALPIFLLRRRHPRLSVCDVGGKPVALVYLLYFILTNAMSLSLLEIFFQDTVNPDFSPFLVLAVVTGVALYGAYRGIEAVARCSTCVCVILVLGILVTFAIVLGRFRTENLEPLFQKGFQTLEKSTVLFLARTTIFADMAVLLPLVKGNALQGFSFWSLGTMVYFLSLIFLLVGCLGRYAYTQNFPVYVLSSITEVRSLQRLDAVFIGVWMMGVCIKLACDFYACRMCLHSLLGKRGEKIGLGAVAAVTLALALVTVYVMAVQRLMLNTQMLFWLTLGVGTAVPLAVWCVDGIVRRRRAK